MVDFSIPTSRHLCPVEMTAACHLDPAMGERREGSGKLEQTFTISFQIWHSNFCPLPYGFITLCLMRMPIHAKRLHSRRPPPLPSRNDA
jgi:hypothetical protein